MLLRQEDTEEFLEGDSIILPPQEYWNQGIIKKENHEENEENINCVYFM